MAWGSNDNAMFSLNSITLFCFGAHRKNVFPGSQGIRLGYVTAFWPIRYGCEGGSHTWP